MSNIRIGFNNNKVVGTALGTMCNMFPQDETTTTIDSTYQSDKAIYKTLVLHTMLHVLGLQDEIVGLQNNFSWNDIKMNDFFTAIQLNKTLSISTSEQYKRKYTLNFSNDFKHNPSSIMLAPIPNTFSQKYTNVKWNKSISENDKKVIQAIYPKRIKKNDTINPIIVFKHLVIQQSVQKDGYSFYPQFKVTSHNKNQSFHLMLFIYNEEGNPIYSSNDSYSLDGQLGDIISKVSGIAKQEDVNSPSLNDVELFIPNFLLQPELKKQKLFAVFKIYYTNSEMEDKWLFVSKPCSIK
jgi:phage pi2 protein 07